MAKTKRTKRNKSPRAIFPNSKAYVVEAGFRIACNGHRAAENGLMKTQPNAKATAIFVGRQYTGVPRGKTYPYAGQKRGGAGVLLPTPRKVVAVTE